MNMKNSPLVTSMKCVTVACPQPKDFIGLMVDECSWEIIDKGGIDSNQEKVWGIAAGSAGKQYSVIRSPNADRGMIRVVKGKNRIRNSPMSTRWSGIEIVVSNDLQSLCQRLEKNNKFEVIKPVNAADFTHAGANIHDFFHGKSPGGTHIMFTMAITQPETYDFPKSPNWVGHIFDVHLDVDNTGNSRIFYQDTLGMELVFDDLLTEGLFYDTWDLNVKTPPVNMSIFKGDAPGFGLGGIEMRSFDKATMDPALPEKRNLDPGTCITSFSTKNIYQTFKAIESSSHASVLTEPTELKQNIYNGGLVFTAIGPEGERIEFTESWLS
ncbi:MAG: hypothetical protein CMM25_04840 [Rhodospirillaceae bacterium]|nr:hypothetical protein [Rhodospirillaceae bacterium]